MKLARRYALGTLVVLLIAIATLLWTAERALEAALTEDVAAHLEREAGLVSAALGDDPAAWQETVHRFASVTGNRITLIDPGGNVVADSDFRPAPLELIENHAGRPEVEAARRGGVGRDIRESETVGRELMYVAVPGDPGVVRVAEDMRRVTTAVRRVQGDVAGAAVIALLVGLVIAFIGARTLARPITALSSAARAIAAGSPPRFPRSGIREVDALVRALREMHQQLGARFDELRWEQAESAALVDAMTEGVIAADARGRITTANPAARRILGYSDADSLPDITELFRIKAARELIAGAMNGSGTRQADVDADGRAYRLTSRALPAGGAVVVLNDLTDTRRLEAVRRDFVANVSHELRTPLTSIRGYAETLLTDQPDEATTRRFLDTILNNSRRMQRLVDDLLDLSRIEAGRWQPNSAPVDVVAVAQEVWSGLSVQHPARAIAFTATAAPDTRLRADPEALRQVLTNLLDNALRHTTAGRISVQGIREGDGVALSVSDSGAGISRDHLHRIFERFYRADPSRSREAGGTGLGLAIVKHLVEAHGGRVSAESELGAGTTITCWFPG